MVKWLAQGLIISGDGFKLFQFDSSMISGKTVGTVETHTKKQDQLCLQNSVSKSRIRASLVVQWPRICLPMQGTQVQSLVQEDPTCCRATKPMCHNYWACTLEPWNCNCWARVLQPLQPMCLEPMLCNKRNQDSKKPTHHNELQLFTPTRAKSMQHQRPSTAKNKSIKIYIYIKKEIGLSQTFS